jgi:hypothetical protein
MRRNGRNHMKTTATTKAVSLPAAQSAGGGQKITRQEAHVTKTLHFATAKCLATPCGGG